MPLHDFQQRNIGGGIIQTGPTAFTNIDPVTGQITPESQPFGGDLRLQEMSDIDDRIQQEIDRQEKSKIDYPKLQRLFRQRNVPVSLQPRIIKQIRDRMGTQKPLYDIDKLMKRKTELIKVGEPKEPKILKDIAGYQKFVKTGKRVFPDAEKSPKKPTLTQEIALRREAASIEEKQRKISELILFIEFYKQIIDKEGLQARDQNKVKYIDLILQHMRERKSYEREIKILTSGKAKKAPSKVLDDPLKLR